MRLGACGYDGSCPLALTSGSSTVHSDVPKTNHIQYNSLLSFGISVKSLSDPKVLAAMVGGPETEDLATRLAGSCIHVHIVEPLQDMPDSCASASTTAWIAI